VNTVENKMADINHVASNNMADINHVTSNKLADKNNEANNNTTDQIDHDDAKILEGNREAVVENVAAEGSTRNEDDQWKGILYCTSGQMFNIIICKSRIVLKSVKKKFKLLNSFCYYLQPFK
jgi:hypothetical protein